MSDFEVGFDFDMGKKFDKLGLSKSMRELIKEKIDRLAENPRPYGSKKLSGKHKDSYRIRQGNYRVIYSIDREKQEVVVLDIAGRGSVYEGVEEDEPEWLYRSS